MPCYGAFLLSSVRRPWRRITHMLRFSSSSAPSSSCSTSTSFRALYARRSRHRKNSTYECGEDPIGSPWLRIHIRYYLFALIYILFAVETVFLFPWAIVYTSLGFFAFIEMMVFIVILLVGLAYAWAKGALEWV